jgi:glycosyltransferase involved in cell wall biosynthesis
VLPYEVLVADDGSGQETRDVIEAHQRDFPVPLVHVWHEDRGFRLSAIRNKAIAQARGDYVVQIDGDIVLHPSFIAAHAQFARRGSYVQGSRCMLSRELSERLLQEGRAHVRLFERGLGNRQNALHWPALSKLVAGPSDPDRRTRGCHMAFWRDDLLAVNGYDEAFEGWGREDSELAARLIHRGVQRRNFKFAAVAYHLWHAPASRQAFAVNDARYMQTIRERRQWCEHGIVWQANTASLLSAAS